MNNLPSVKSLILTGRLWLGSAVCIGLTVKVSTDEGVLLDDTSNTELVEDIVVLGVVRSTVVLIFTEDTSIGITWIADVAEDGVVVNKLLVDGVGEDVKISVEESFLLFAALESSTQPSGVVIGTQSKRKSKYKYPKQVIFEVDNKFKLIFKVKKLCFSY